MEYDLVTEYSGMVRRARKNTRSKNWKWDVDPTLWKLAEDKWQQFSSLWYGRGDDNSLSADSSFSLEPLASESLLVRQCYVDIFSRVWARAFISSRLEGAIISGQPGTGKSMLDYFFVIRLLQRKQIVLFSADGISVFLFYRGEVYYSSTPALLMSESPLPQPKSSKVFIWSIFDIAKMEEPASFFFSPPCLPVQTASPNPERYKIWAKECRPMRIGMPLWTHRELGLGLKHQIEYDSLVHALRKYHQDSSQRALASFGGTHILLQDRAEDDAGPLPPEDALDYLLNESIDRFGYSARDVYNGVFDYDGTTIEHEEAFGINYNELIEAVRGLSGNYSPPHARSYKILACSPLHIDAFSRVRWQVNFKSNWVARAVIKRLGKAENGQCIRYFHRMPEASQLAGRFLEPFAHHAILDAEGDSWPLIKMTPTNADANSPLFSMESSPDPDPPTFPSVKRKTVKFFSLDSVLLENNTYYIPVDPCFPLFDAFTVEVDLPTKSADLWVLQMTTSPLHGGSARGYRAIRRIVAELKAMLNQEAPKEKSKKRTPGQSVSEAVVHVHYILVIPKGERDRQWAFPIGWNENCTRNDHRGSVYYLQVAVSVEEIAARYSSSKPVPLL